MVTMNYALSDTNIRDGVVYKYHTHTNNNGFGIICSNVKCFSPISTDEQKLGVAYLISGPVGSPDRSYVTVDSYANYVWLDRHLTENYSYEGLWLSGSVDGTFIVGGVPDVKLFRLIDSLNDYPIFCDDTFAEVVDKCVMESCREYIFNEFIEVSNEVDKSIISKVTKYDVANAVMQIVLEDGPNFRGLQLQFSAKDNFQRLIEVML